MRWTARIFVLGLLAIASPTTAQPTDLFGPPAQAAAERSPAISLTKVGSSMTPGEIWRVRRSSLICNVAGRDRWSAVEAAGFEAGSLFPVVFNDEMTKAGYRVGGRDRTDLFASRVENPNFQVGALITRVSLDVCQPGGGRDDPILRAKGSAALAIEWQIYSLAQGRVVARIPTEGSSVVKSPSDDGVQRLMREALAANLRALVAAPAFGMALKAAPASSAPALSDIRVGLPKTAAALPLGMAAKSVATIFTGHGMGSGFLISSDGYLLTNHHVVGNSGVVRVRWADGSETAGEVIRGDQRRDVALVKAAPSSVAPLTIRGTPAQVGETVFAIGTPLDKELSGTVTRGIVSSTRTLEGQPWIQSDVAVTQGSSGGPLLDESGAIVGLTSWGVAPNGASANLNFFVPIDDALRALSLKPML